MQGSPGASSSSAGDRDEPPMSSIVTEGNSSPQSTSGAASPARLDTRALETTPAPSAAKAERPAWASRAWDRQGPASIINAARAAAEMSRTESPATAAEASANAAAARGERPVVSSKPRGRATTAAARVAAQREKAPLRKGKWTQEEELFTAAVIREFERGMLACPAGTTLRSYLSEKLHCDPMRITKKFAGDASIGKRVFAPCKATPELLEEARRVRAELRETERRFASHLQHASLAYAASSALKGRGRAGSLGGRRPRLDVHRPVMMDADGRILQQGSLKRARDDAVKPDPKDSQLLLDFFVAVRERCGSDADAEAPPAPPAPDGEEAKERSDSLTTRPRTPADVALEALTRC